jgi:hypothetical protein
MVLKARKTGSVIPVGCPAHNGGGSAAAGGCPVMDYGDKNKTNKSLLEQAHIDEKVADDMATIYSIIILKVGVIILVAIILWFMESFEAPPGSPAYGVLETEAASAGATASMGGGMAAEHITMGTVGGHT